MRSIKRIITLVLILAVICAGLFAGYKFTHFFDFVRRKPLTIEKTANVVEEVKKIGEFTTACYYEEMALHESYTDTSEFLTSDFANKYVTFYMDLYTLGLNHKNNKNAAKKVTNTIGKKKNEIILICKGRVRAGFDLAKIGEDDLIARGDTLELALPQPEVFDIIMNPSDFTTEYEKGTWSHELLKPVKERAKVELEQNAIDYGILQKAEENGLKRLEALFKAFGFNSVVLAVNEPAVEAPVAEE